jgi:hypothetical protein
VNETPKLLEGVWVCFQTGNDFGSFYDLHIFSSAGELAYFLGSTNTHYYTRFLKYGEELKL